MQGHGVGFAANVPGYHTHCSELAHGARIAQQDTVQGTPSHVWQGHMPDHLPTVGTQARCRLFIIGALLLHQRNEFSRHKGEGDKHGHQHDAGCGKDDLYIHGVRQRTCPSRFGTNPNMLRSKMRKQGIR